MYLVEVIYGRISSFNSNRGNKVYIEMQGAFRNSLGSLDVVTFEIWEFQWQNR